jgi:flagellar biosynthesis protein FlhA
MQVNAAKLLGRVETQQLVEHVTKLAPKLIEDVVPKMVGIATLQKVLQLLLEEGVHIRDMRSIVECLAEHAGAATDPGRAGRAACALPVPGHRAADLRPGEGAGRDRHRARPGAPGGAGPDQPARPALDPGVADTLTRRPPKREQQEDMGLPACLLVPDLIRAPMARLLKRAAPRLKVLGHSEIPETHSIRIAICHRSPA